MNQIIRLLEAQPCTAKELPYRVYGVNMSIPDRARIKSIRFTTNHTKKPGRGRFRIVYYLTGDEDRALRKFADINAALLSALDLSRSCLIDSALPRTMSKKLRAIL